MKSLFPEEKPALISASILLCNTYLSIGEHELAQQIRTSRIKEFGNKVEPGVTWTNVKGELTVKFCRYNAHLYETIAFHCQEFQAHDRFHPRSDEIYAEVDRLSTQLKAHGHVYDARWITRPLKPGETVESVLSGHSEKLAIAYNLIQRPSPTLIQLTKNLRVCGDCRTYRFASADLFLVNLFSVDSATKLIAKIRQCDIVVRDANRIHRFTKDGKCSCNDRF